MKDLSREIHVAETMINGSRGESLARQMPLIFRVLREPLEKAPFARGAADAFCLLGIADREVGLIHQAEMFNLLAYRMRASLIRKDLLSVILTNLSQSCLVQKSFEEAYRYGLLAERLVPSDDDLLAILTIACVMTYRDDEAKSYRSRLAAINSAMLDQVEAILAGKGLMRPTRTQGCSGILAEMRKITEGKPHFWNFLHRRRDQRRMMELTRDLTLRPDGTEAWKCWKILLDFYVYDVSSLPLDSPLNHLMKLEGSAGATAAAGKVINMHPTHAAEEPQVWLWYGQSLSQMCLYDLAVEAFEKTLEISGKGSEFFAPALDNLDYCRAMARLPDDSPKRPDSKAFWFRINSAWELGQVRQ